MKTHYFYQDGTPAKTGDKIQRSYYGTCQIVAMDELNATIRNIVTGEEWDGIVDFRDFDLCS